MKTLWEKSRFWIGCVLAAMTVTFTANAIIGISEGTYGGRASVATVSEGDRRLFDVQSIDTMKHSRDLAREKLADPSFDSVIESEMRLAKEAGATHVAVGTPYDEEFLPMLSRWVRKAREQGLSVWFRGNFSGWEGWFGYPRITADEHAHLLERFIEGNPALFEDGDIFSACPECENGGPGDPRKTGERDEHNDFLRREYGIATRSFKKIGRDVSVYTSMNADIARDVITPDAADDIGGTVLIDHYLSDPGRLAADVASIAEDLDTRVGIGEFGAPIPDLNGNMTEGEQAEFVRRTLDGLAAAEEDERTRLVNYWVMRGGTTALIRDDGTPKEAYDVVSSYFSPLALSGRVVDPLGGGVRGAEVSIDGSLIRAETSRNGSYEILVPRIYDNATLRKDGYAERTVPLSELASSSPSELVLEPTRPSLWYRIRSAF